MNKRILVVVVLIVFLVGCVADANTAQGTGEVIAGFWAGLWHGLISPITFFISLFSDSASIYEIHNNGAWYNFGFLLGVGAFSSGASSSKSSK